MSVIKAIAPVIIKPSAKHTASVIFLHGLGDTGKGISDGLKYFGLKSLNHVRYTFPTAPVVPITAYGGEMLTAWFDIGSALNDQERDIECSASKIDEMIGDEEKLGISSDRIVIGGFSQGGAMSLYWALSRPKSVAGIVGLSCWTPCSHRFSRKFEGNSSTYSFIGHGTNDSMVPLSWAKHSHDLFGKLLPNCTRKTYKGLEHGICIEEMKDIQNFISSRLPEIKK